MESVAHLRLANHHNTTSKIKRVKLDGVIADGLRSFAGDSYEDWLDLVQLVEFAINNSA